MKLCMQGDGNLVLYTSDNKALWETSSLPILDVNGFSGPTEGMNCASCFASFQGDGNLVLYDPALPGTGNKAYWASRTGGNSGATLNISADSPYIRIVNGGGVPIWTGAAPDNLQFGQVCPSNQICNFSATQVDFRSYSMSCSSGSDLQVLNVIYGFGTKTESCTGYGQTSCDGKSSCTFIFEPSTCGGDPDPGVKKKRNRVRLLLFFLSFIIRVGLRRNLWSLVRRGNFSALHVCRL